MNNSEMQRVRRLRQTNNGRRYTHRASRFRQPFSAPAERGVRLFVPARFIASDDVRRRMPPEPDAHAAYAADSPPHASRPCRPKPHRAEAPYRGMPLHTPGRPHRLIDPNQQPAFMIPAEQRAASRTVPRFLADEDQLVTAWAYFRASSASNARTAAEHRARSAHFREDAGSFSEQFLKNAEHDQNDDDDEQKHQGAQKFQQCDDHNRKAAPRLLN